MVSILCLVGTRDAIGGLGIFGAYATFSFAYNGVYTYVSRVVTKTVRFAICVRLGRAISFARNMCLCVVFTNGCHVKFYLGSLGIRGGLPIYSGGTRVFTTRGCRAIYKGDEGHRPRDGIATPQGTMKCECAPIFRVYCKCFLKGAISMGVFCVCVCVGLLWVFTLNERVRSSVTMVDPGLFFGDRATGYGNTHFCDSVAIGSRFGNLFISRFYLYGLWQDYVFIYGLRGSCFVQLRVRQGNIAM